MTKKEATQLVQIVCKSWTQRMPEGEIIRQLELSGFTTTEARHALEVITTGYKAGNVAAITGGLSARNYSTGNDILFDAAFCIGREEIRQASIPTTNKFLNRLLWPNLWVGIFSALAAAGIICMLFGHFKGSPELTRIGLWLIMPLVAGGVFLVIVVFPYLIILNRRAKKRQEQAAKQGNE